MHAMQMLIVIHENLSRRFVLILSFACFDLHQLCTCCGSYFHAYMKYTSMQLQICDFISLTWDAVLPFYWHILPLCIGMCISRYNLQIYFIFFYFLVKSYCCLVQLLSCSWTRLLSCSVTDLTYYCTGIVKITKYSWEKKVEIRESWRFVRHELSSVLLANDLDVKATMK